jgi:SAM-dependent methyltransferase
VIKILQNWEEIGVAAKFLGHKELPKHTSGEKCWDLYQLYQIAAGLTRQGKIIDLGCGGICTLKFLRAMGFSNLHGVDLHISLTDRAGQVVQMIRNRTFNRPFRLYRRDLTDTQLPAETFDMATCISVIEHWVDYKKFLTESYRLLKPGGLLVVTADYWEDKINLSGDSGDFGLPWDILSRADAEHLIELAQSCGFKLYQNSTVGDCCDRPIVWHQQEYTFIALAFVKQS